MPFDQERQYYRMLLPPGDTVTFDPGHRRMPVLEISERGLRYAPGTGEYLEPGTPVTGTVRMKTIGEFEVTGTVSRWQDRSIVIVFDSPGLRYTALMSLQLYLRRHYPDRKDR